MPSPRLPLAVDLAINRFIGGTITEYDRGIVNGIVDRRGDRLYVTQRPGIDVFDTPDYQATGYEPDTWVTIPSPAGSQQSRNFAYLGDGRWIANFSSTIAVSSDNGLTWAVVDTGYTLDGCAGLAAAGDVVVVGCTIASTPSILRSTDRGATWAQITSGVDVQAAAIAYADGRFVGVGAASALVSEDGGATWTTEADVIGGSGFGFRAGIRAGGGRFVAPYGYVDGLTIVSGLAVYDGDAWSTEAHVTEEFIFGIAYDGEHFALSTDASLYLVPDPTDSGTWELIAANPTAPNAGALHYVNDVWVTGLLDLYTARNLAGPWTQRQDWDDGGASYVFNVAYGDGVFMAGGQYVSGGGYQMMRAVMPDPPVTGRAITYWDAGLSVYAVNGPYLYRGSYGSVLAEISAGSQRCYFFPVGDELALLDPENDEGWLVEVDGTVTEIDDEDFPPQQTPSVGLAHGGAVLNGRLYVLGEDGVISGSDLRDASAWNALNFLEAERQPDGGVYLALHHDHLIAFGPRTIEVFYDAANSTGSPLSRRQDVAYNMGCISGESVWVDGDRIWFCGVDASGSVGVYVMEQFRPRKVSSGALDAILTQAIVRDGYAAVGCAVSAYGHPCYTLTLISIGDDGTRLDPEETLIYDDATQLWLRWESGIEGLERFPLISWTARTGVLPRTGEGIAANGALLTLSENLVPQDSVRGTGYDEGDYFAEDYVSETPSEGAPLAMRLRTGMQDFGTSRKKFLSELRIEADRAQTDGPCLVRWSDEHSNAFTAGRALDISADRKLTRLGNFRRRNFEVVYGGSEQVRLEALDIVAQTGSS